MLTDIEIEDILFAYIKGSELANAVTGNLEKEPRTQTSKAEDIVIHVLSNLGGEEQLAIVNVNIYVANIPDSNGQQQPNRPRLRTLCRKADDLLKHHHGGYYILESDQHVFNQDATNERVINNRVKLKIINS